MDSKKVIKIVHNKQIRRVPLASQLNVDSFYQECGRICGLKKGTFTVSYQSDVGTCKCLCLTEEDMKILFRESEKPVKVFILDDVPCQVTNKQTTDSSRFDHKYDQPPDASLVDFATVSDLTTSLDSVSQSTEFTSIPIDSSLSFAFALAPASNSSPDPDPNEPVVSPSVSITSTSDPTTPAVVAVPSPDPSGPSSDAKPSHSDIVVQLSQKISELQLIVNDHREDQQRLVSVCSNLVSTVDSLKESMGRLLSDVRIEIRNEMREQFSADFFKRMTEEMTKEVKAEIQRQFTSSTNTSLPPNPEESKDDDGLVRLQASVSSPEQVEALKKFESMGFTNQTFTSVLLEIHKGDEDKVLADLKKFYQVKI